AASGQMDQVGVSPEPDPRPGPGRAQPDLAPGYPHVPRRGNGPVELDRPTVPWRTPGGNLRAARRPGAGSRRAGRPEPPGARGRPAPAAAGAPGVNRPAGVTGTFSSSAWC